MFYSVFIEDYGGLLGKHCLWNDKIIYKGIGKPIIFWENYTET
jgi:hypothetical protein